MSSSKVNSGNYRILLIAIIGLGLAGLLFMFNQPIPAGFVIIILGTLVLGMVISADAARSARPILMADLSKNHREIIIENAGTIVAEKIQVTAAGMDNSWDIGRLEPDTTTKITLPFMITMLSIEVSYETVEGNRKSKVFTLGSPEAEQDPYKPFFPLFNWK